MTRPVHFEILGDDPEGLGNFYRAVFGWEIANWEGPEPYWLVTTGPAGKPGINGGLMHKNLSQPVIITCEVESLDDCITKLKAAGGKKIAGPTEVPGVGVHAYCADPEGNIFGLLEPALP